MSVEGSLDIFELHEILQTVAQQQKTGILTVQGQDDIVAISFLKGRVVAADSLNQPGEEGLQQVLLSEALVEANDLAEVSELQEKRGARLQDLLLDRGLIDRSQLLAALRLQYQELLIKLLHWREGEFKFYANDEVAFEEGLQPIVVQDLLLQHYHPEESEPVPDATPVPVEEGEVRRGVALERLPMGKPIKVRAAGAEATSDDEGFIVLTPLEQQILGRVNGERSIEDLALDCGLEPPWVQGAVDRLQMLGLVRPRGVLDGAVGDSRGVTPMPSIGESLADPTLELDLHSLPSVDLLEDEGRERSPRRLVGAVSSEQREALVTWGSRLLAVLAAFGLMLVLARSPQLLLLPFPWLQEQELALVAQQREAVHWSIDHAAKTYFLMAGRFPEQLDTLVEAGLLSPSLLEDPAGYPLHYVPGDVQYQLMPVAGGDSMVELGTSEAITGNFLLDLDFFSIPGSTLQQPLVLVD